MARSLRSNVFLAVPLVAAFLGASTAPLARAGDVPDDEATAWAKKVEESVSARDAAFLDAAFDMGAVGERAVEGLKLKPATKRGFLDGVKKGGSLGKSIVNSLGEQGTWKFLRLAKRGESRVAIFRFATVEHGFGYDEFYLDKNAAGEIRINDCFVYTSGEKMSATLRRTALPLAVEQDKSILERLVGSESDYVKHMAEVSDMTRLGNEGKPAEALAVYKKLPASLQTDRIVLLVRLRIAQEVGDDEYKDALDTVEKTFGKDPAMAFVLLDRNIIAKDWTKVFATLETLEKAVGGDPYIDYERSLVHNLKSDKKESKAAAEKAIEREPDLLAAHWHLIGLALEEKSWADVKKGLERVEKLGVELNDLTTIEEYSEFVKSSEFADWVKARAKK